MHSPNFGILAHVNTNKSSLTERLLSTASAIDQLGCVDTGNSQAVVSSGIVGRFVNPIDIPNRLDFAAEDERTLSVPDGARNFCRMHEKREALR